MVNPIELSSSESVSDNELIVRLKTESWFDNKGIYIKKKILFMKRLSKGFNLLLEDCVQIGSEEVDGRIINLDECSDGLYKVIICHEYRDWETGMIEDWEYKLIPVMEPFCKETL
jgi:hypothetical protein